MIKNCDNCRFTDLMISQKPCISCGDNEEYDEWKAKKQTVSTLHMTLDIDTSAANKALKQLSDTLDNVIDKMNTIKEFNASCDQINVITEITDNMLSKISDDTIKEVAHIMRERLKDYGTKL